MGELYIGLMSGTSLDGVDAVLVDLTAGLPSLVAASTDPYPVTVRKALLELNRPQASLERMLELDVRLGELYAQSVERLLQSAGIASSQIMAIGSHGQTIRHLPSDGTIHTTLQIGDPNILAQRTGITTVADFRRRDMAAGGQGAPLVPAFHHAFFHRQGENRVVVNIGGISNITILPGDSTRSVTGFDTGPGNLLLDGWAERHLREPMDEDGTWAASGEVRPALLERMLGDPFFQQPPPKSTGRERFNLAWLDDICDGQNLEPADVAATLCALTATCITQAIRQHAPATERIIVCGGGAHNRTLMTRLAELAHPAIVEPSTAHRMAPDWVEAVAFAWLAQRTLQGKPGNLPSVTGAGHEVVLGAIYPG